MLNIKKPSIIFSILFIFSFLVGCASHSPIQQPSLYSNMEAQQNKITSDQIEIMVRPIVSKSDNKAYYDEDLILYGVLPIHVCFKNINPDASRHIKAEKAALVDPEGISNPPLTLKEVYAKASKSYLRTIGWGAAFGLLGAVPSAVNVAVVNDKIKADYESCMIKSGKLVSGAYTEGSMFFKIENKIESLDGWKLQFDFEDENGPKPVTFALSGEVEQPRAPKNAGDPQDVGVHYQDSNKSNESSKNTQGEIALKINPQEPWTGKWKVEGGLYYSGQWAMKQNGNIVKSTTDSYFDFKGKVSGDQLKGNAKADSTFSRTFVIIISQDRQSFEGKIGDYTGTVLLEGRRIE